MQANIFGNTGRTDDAETLAALEVDYTPPAVAVQLLLALRRELADLGLSAGTGHALDPSAGSGCWGRAMRAVLGPDVLLVGVEPRESEALNVRRTYDEGHCYDFRSILRLHRWSYDLVATNPPFSAFEPGEFWPMALHEAGLLHPCSIVALLGLSSWGQSEGAAGSLRAWSPALQLRLGGRAAFRGGGQTDAREYSLWVWSCADRSRCIGRRPSWRTVQLPALPTALRRWSPAAVPGTYAIDPALVAEIGAKYL